MPPAPLYGVLAAPVCPMRDDQSLDEPGIEAYFAWLAARPGMQGLVVNVNAGEGNLLDDDERRRVLRIARRHLPAPMRVVGGVCGYNTADAIRQVKWLEQEGADAAIIVPMRDWMNSRAPGHAEGAYASIARATGFPLICFQSPSAVFDTATLLRIIDVPSVVAVKHGVPDIGAYEEQYHAVKSKRPEVAMLSAHDAILFPALAVGADGVLLGLAGFLPDLIIRLYQAMQRGDYAAGKQAAAELAPIAHFLYGVPPRALRHIRTKAAMQRLGIIRSAMVREPMLPLDEAELTRLFAAMSRAGLLPEEAALKKDKEAVLF